jgi:hypothetical protein
MPAAEPESSGIGMGTLLLGALVVGGGLWLLIRMFRRKSAPQNAPYAANPTNPAGNGPDFLPNSPNNGPGGNNYNRGPGNQQGGNPDFYSNRGGNSGGGGLGSGMGGVLMTGAAAAAGAYLGNRMASGHDTSNVPHYGADNTPTPLDHGTNAGAHTASGGFPALGGNDGTNESAPDYFSDNAANDSPDYFSSDDNSSYDDMSSDDTGGGGFDDDNSNSGDW